MPAPAPASLEAVADVVRRSRLVPADRLDAALDELHDAGADPDALLPHLQAAGLLTRFQAAQLGRGKYKGFLLGTHYRILDVLGQGGMGTVYLAEHGALRKRMAVKVLTPELAGDPVALARFTREARAAARLHHPNIVHTVDIDPDSNPPYLVMEYVDGVTLQAAVAHTGTFAPETAAFCAVQALAGLQTAHEQGLVHRDVKPANIIVDRKGVVKLLDLGIVRLNKSDGGLTMAPGQGKVILGTADYLSPEQAMDSSTVDTRADVYGVGGVLYFLLAGHPPFHTGPAARKLVMKQMQDPPPVHTLRPDVSPQLSAVVGKLLARKSEDRYASPAAAAAALAPFAAPETGFPARLFGQQAPDLLTTPPPVGRLAGEDTPPPVPEGLSNSSGLYPVLSSGVAAEVAAEVAAALTPRPEPAPARAAPARGNPWAAVVIGAAVLAGAAAAVWSAL